LLEMAVEVTREDPVERVVVKRQIERVALHEARVWRLRSRDTEHALARIERNHVSAQVPSQEAGATGYVEGRASGKSRNRLFQTAALLVPARPYAARVEAAAEPPVVVFLCTPVVVRLHRF
jgi:hypothetical protein